MRTARIGGAYVHLRTTAQLVGIAVGVPVVVEAALVVRALVDGGDDRGSARTARYPNVDDRHPALVQLVDGAKILASSIASRIHRPQHPGAVPADRQLAPAADAAAAWKALTATSEVRGERGVFHAHPGAPYHASVWAMSQVLNGAIDMAGQSGDWSEVSAITARLASMYGDGPWSDGLPIVPSSWSIGARPFYDDNAWVALDLLQAYRGTGDRSWLDRTQQLVPFFQSGVRDDGGVLWGRDEPEPSVNTCSAGPVGQVFAQLYAATGNREHLDTAIRIERYLVANLRQPDGLYGDNVDLASGQVDAKLFSYNQGTPIGLQLELYRATGDRSYLDRARQTAASAVRWMSTGDTMWNQLPSFNAIFFRNLLALDEVAPDPSYRALLDTYLQRALRDGLDPETGLYTAGGIPQYGPRGNVLDQAGMVQMFALAAGADPGR